jgi:predicted nucleotidyltransferase
MVYNQGISIERCYGLLNINSIPKTQLFDFCERNHIRKLALFGSVLRDDFDAQSDIDVLVEFVPGHVPGWEFVTMQDELTEIFERKVDLNTPGFLSDTFREDVLQHAVLIYERLG